MNSKKRKEQKQIITLVIAFFAVLALVVVFFVVKNAVSDGDVGDTTGFYDVYDILGQQGTFTLINEDFKLITALEYTYGGETVKAHIEGGYWTMTDDDDFPVDQEKFVMMSQAISDYGGFRQIVYREESREQYGIDEPLYDITATYLNSSDSDPADTHTVHVLVGKQNSITGYYYFYIPGSSYIYMVNDALFEYFSYKRAELFDNPATPAPTPGDVIALDIVTGDGEYHYDKEADTEEADSERVGKTLESLPRSGALSYDNVEAYGVGEGELSSYGLDSPAATVSMKYYEYTTVPTADGGSSARMPKETEYFLLFGSRVAADGGAGYVYVTVKDSGIVYKISSIYIDGIMDVVTNAQ